MKSVILIDILLMEAVLYLAGVSHWRTENLHQKKAQENREGRPKFGVKIIFNSISLVP